VEGQGSVVSFAHLDPGHRSELSEVAPEVITPENNCACAALRSASRAITQLYDLVLAPTGLKSTQFLILKKIFEAGEIAQCDFAREHAIAVETLSRRFAGLRAKSLVELRIGEHHRERMYRLTALGKERFEAAVPYWLLAQCRLRQTLGETDWNVLLEFPQRICKAAQAAEQVPMSSPRSSRAGSTIARLKLYTNSPK
jgi:DNA-binding MarR family transcriptional regulator